MPRSHPMTHEAVFRASPTATLVLDLQLCILDANPAYLRATGRELDELIGRDLFEAFPANPDHPDGDGVDNVRASIRRALDTRRPDGMWVQRYDIPSSRRSPAFEERYWSPVNTPVLDAEGEPIGIIHTVEDVTPFRDELIKALEFYREAAASGAEPSVELDRRFADHAATTLSTTRLFSDLVTEVEQLREALTSRAAIEQAKGILMLRTRCTAQEAFELLSRRSQERNIKLRDVAAELVANAAQAQSPDRHGAARR